jgi:hypothetical protein
MNKFENELENKLSVSPFKKQMFSKQFMINVEQKIKVPERKNVWNRHKIILFSLSIIMMLGLFIGALETGLIHLKVNEVTGIPAGTSTPQSLSYENTKYNFTLKIPKTWEGKYEVVDTVIEANNVENIDFIYKASKGYGGVLFTISIWSKADAEDAAKHIQVSTLGEKGNKVFSLSTPSDVQIDPKDDKMKTEYQSMWNDIKTIKATFMIETASKTSSPNIHYLNDNDELPQGKLTKESATIGNIHLGDSQDFVQKTLGNPVSKSIAHSTPFPMWEYKKDNLYVMFYRKGESTPVGGVVDMKVQSPTTLKTDKNIGIGSSIKQIAAAYGDVYVKGDSNVFVSGANVTQDPSGIKYYYPEFIFNIVDNKVTGMELTNMEIKP